MNNDDYGIDKTLDLFLSSETTIKPWQLYVM